MNKCTPEEIALLDGNPCRESCSIHSNLIASPGTWHRESMIELREEAGKDSLSMA